MKDELATRRGIPVIRVGSSVYLAPEMIRNDDFLPKSAPIAAKRAILREKLFQIRRKRLRIAK